MLVKVYWSPWESNDFWRSIWMSRRDIFPQTSFPQRGKVWGVSFDGQISVFPPFSPPGLPIDAQRRDEPE